MATSSTIPIRPKRPHNSLSFFITIFRALVDKAPYSHPHPEERQSPLDPPLLRGAKNWQQAVVVFIIAAVVFAQFGFKGLLMRDNAIYLYSGQQMANGVPPYQSIFDHKGPMAPFLIVVPVKVASIAGVDDLVAVRVFFFLLSCLTVVGLYLLGKQTFHSNRISLLAACVFLGMTAFGMHASMGPRAKTPMVLFEIFALYFIGRNCWFRAGLSGALAGLTWQPAGIFVIVALFLVWKWEKGKLLRFVAGVALPFFLTALYFIIKGAWSEFWYGYVLFNFVYLTREQVGLAEHFRIIYSSIIQGYSPMGPVVLAGLLMMGWLCIRNILWYWTRYRTNSSEDSSPSPYPKKPLNLLLWTFPFPVIVTLLDFQGPVDLFILLPYACLGAGLLLDVVLKQMRRLEGINRSVVNKVALGICCFMVILAGFKYWSMSNRGLEEQIAAIQEAEKVLPAETRIVSIGVPEYLALTHRANPNPYMFIMNGIDVYIERRTPGGLAGWMDSISSIENVCIAYGGASGPYADEIQQWLENNFELVWTKQFLLYQRKTFNENT